MRDATLEQLYREYGRLLQPQFVYPDADPKTVANWQRPDGSLVLV